MILIDQQIRETCKKGDIFIEPFSDKQVQPATYDLRVGNQGATTSTKKIVDIKEKGYISLEPGDFGVFRSAVKVCEKRANRNNGSSD